MSTTGTTKRTGLHSFARIRSSQRKRLSASMAKDGRLNVILKCSECGSENYNASRNKKLHAEKMEVRSTSSFDYEAITTTSTLVGDKVVEYYNFGRVKFAKDSELKKYDSKMIKGIDIVYDKSTYNDGDILSDYKIVKVYYANGETEGNDVSIIRNDDVEHDYSHDHTVEVATDSEIASMSQIPDEHTVEKKYEEMMKQIKEG